MNVGTALIPVPTAGTSDMAKKPTALETPTEVLPTQMGPHPPLSLMDWAAKRGNGTVLIVAASILLWYGVGWLGPTVEKHYTEDRGLREKLLVQMALDTEATKQNTEETKAMRVAIVDLAKMLEARERAANRLPPDNQDVARNLGD